MNALDTVGTRNGITMLLCADDGPVLATEQDAVDLIASTFHQGVELIVLPVTRLDERFFDLRSGVAGQLVQKFTQYRRRLAVVGDISAHVAASNALRDYVREANRGTAIWFVPDMAALDARTAGR